MRSTPISGIIFGILNIGYGLLNLLNVIFPLVVSSVLASNPNSSLKNLIGDPNSLDGTWIVTITSAVGGLVLAVAGIGLLMGRNWGRVLSIGWAWFDTLLSLGSIPVFWGYSMKMASALKGAPQTSVAVVLTLLILFASLIPPGILLIFMNRPKMVAAYKNAATG